MLYVLKNYTLLQFCSNVLSHILDLWSCIKKSMNYYIILINKTLTKLLLLSFLRKKIPSIQLIFQQLVCYDADSDGSHDLIGECYVTMKQLEAAPKVKKNYALSTKI